MANPSAPVDVAVRRLSRETAIRILELATVIPTLGLIGGHLVMDDFAHFREPGHVADFFFWLFLVTVVEFFPVPAWRSAHVSIGFPLLMAVAFLDPPHVAATVALIGSSDPRELRGEVTLLRALFNRSQIALSVYAASAAFHLLGDAAAPWQTLFGAALLAVLVDYIVNSSLVSLAGSLIYAVSFREVLRKLRIGSPLEFLVSYMGLGVLGAMLARLHVEVGAWAVVTFVMPLLLARQMFFRTRALEDAARELQDREVALRALSNRMAEERHDERVQIASYLHDDLAQLLYRMSLHIDISRKHLEMGDPEQAKAELETIRETKERTLTLVRSLIKDLHRSPLGRAGLTEALSSFCSDIEQDSRLRFVTDLREVEMPAAIQLLCYQVAREAIMNVVKHAHASTVRVSLTPTEDGARLIVADDGIGFDVEAGSPEGHYGLTLMREQTQIAGGSLHMSSTPGEGSTIVAEFKTTWLAEPDGAPVPGLSAPGDRA